MSILSDVSLGNSANSNRYSTSYNLISSIGFTDEILGFNSG
jgi:hypothetical protein